MQADLPPSIEAAWRDDGGEDGEEQQPLPFFVMLGLLGGDLGNKPLPSHGGASLPTTSFHRPQQGAIVGQQGAIAGHGRSGLFLSRPNTAATPAIPSVQPGTGRPAGSGLGAQP